MPGRKPERSRPAATPAISGQPVQPPDPVRSSRHGLSRFVPIAIFLAVLGSIAAGAFRAIGRGDRLGAIVPLIVIGVAALSVWRSARRRSHLGMPRHLGGNPDER